MGPELGRSLFIGMALDSPIVAEEIWALAERQVENALKTQVHKTPPWVETDLIFNGACRILRWPHVTELSDILKAIEKRDPDAVVKARWGDTSVKVLDKYMEIVDWHRDNGLALYDPELYRPV